MKSLGGQLKLLICCLAISSLHGRELKFVQLIVRHGERTPLRKLPADTDHQWTDGLGQLTNQGKFNQFLLGKWIRERYAAFLPEKYSSDDIYIRSSDSDRVLMSAQCLLSGLYEPNEDNWSSDIRWQPVPVHTTPEHQDNKLGFGTPCLRHQVLRQQLRHVEYFKNITKEYQELFLFLSLKTGWKIRSLGPLVVVHDYLSIQESSGMELPSWSRGIYPEPLRNLTRIWFDTHCYNTELCRLSVGPLLEELIRNFYQKTENNTKEKMKIYATHDLPMLNILKVLNASLYEVLPFNAVIILELRKYDEEYVVEVFYKNACEAVKLTLPHCGDVCSLDEFKTALNPVIPLNWTAECEIS